MTGTSIYLFIYFQTGNESSVDRLMKQISSFMSEISDEFKIVVVDAIRCVTYFVILECSSVF